MKKSFLIFLSIILLLPGTLVKAEHLIKNVIKKDILTNWEFSKADSLKWYPAIIPGCVHTDLLNNKLIPDPYFGTNEHSLQWIGKEDWIYKTNFDVPAGLMAKKNIELVFKGLDTYADVYLNDSLIFSADNMFREWKIPCKGLLKEKDNYLKIYFNNVFKVNIPKWECAPFRLMAFPNNDQADTMIAMYSRKAQFHYGWDWGPRLITCGIWRKVYLEGWDNFKINNVQVIQRNISKENAEINAVINIISDSEDDAGVKVNIDDSGYVNKNFQLKKGLNKIPVSFKIHNPNLWWTNGLGNHYLYDFNFIVQSDNNFADSANIKIGIRSLEVIRKKDSLGTAFYIKLNGYPVFMKGANYIPQDNFQNLVTEKRYEHIIKSAADANINLLRVWGGGIYEDDEFYNLCDKYGILVWQEFMFACAMYPADSNFLYSVKHEVIDNVTRIRNHASLALYCGNNENEISWYQWGWKEKYSPEVQKQYEINMHKLFYETIPDALKETDTTRYYHHTSPSAGFNNISNSDGDIHYWGVWHGKEPFQSFNANISRFVSEYGFQSYPEISTIKKFSLPGDMQLHSNVMLSHQRCMADDRKDKEYGNRLIQLYMQRQFEEPKDFASYVYVSQILQAEGDKNAIEAHRRNMPFCMGSAYWQIDDCWPAASWSSIDYYGNWKALHYYVKNAYRTFLITNVLNNDSLSFFIVSDSLNPVKAELTIKVIDFNGNEIYNDSIPVSISPNSSNDYLKLSRYDLVKKADESSIVLISKLKAGSRILTGNTFFFKKYKELNFEKPEIKIDAVKTDDGYDLKLNTDKYAKDVYLSFENNDGFFEDNYFDLFPGDVKKVRYQTGKPIDGFLKKLKIISLADSY